MNNPTILITGGTGKFGRKYVEHFLNKGWKVLFTSTREDRSNELKVVLGSNPNLHGFVVDLARPSSISELVQNISDKGFQINHLVNNARSLHSLKVNEDGITTREYFMDEYLMDVVVPYELTMALYKLQPSSLLTVNNISSQYGVVAANPALYTNHAIQSPIQYGVAKAALNHLTKELAVRFADKGIRVNCIAYGGVEGRVDDEFKERYARLTPIRRMLREEDIAGPLDFLVSELSSAMTGQTLVVDGGWSIW